MNIKKTVFYALAVAIGLTLSYVELLIPVNLGVPGAKIGLPNIMTILMLYVFGAVPAFYTAVLRIIERFSVRQSFFHNIFLCGAYTEPCGDGPDEADGKIWDLRSEQCWRRHAQSGTAYSGGAPYEYICFYLFSGPDILRSHCRHTYGNRRRHDHGKDFSFFKENLKRDVSYACGNIAADMVKSLIVENRSYQDRVIF